MADPFDDENFRFDGSAEGDSIIFLHYFICSIVCESADIFGVPELTVFLFKLLIPIFSFNH
jgi:hypothetical protein